MKSLQQYVTEKLKVSNANIVVPSNVEELDEAIIEAIEENGLNCDLNHIDVSSITDMSYLFGYRKYASKSQVKEFTPKGSTESMKDFTKFNGDISKWDVSNVKDMSSMFYQSEFNGDISKWDVSNVKDMSDMFYQSDFTGDLSKWNVSNVENMQSMFAHTVNCNTDISGWDVSNVINAESMFFSADSFNQDLSSWDFVKMTKRPKNMFTYSPMYRRPKIQPKIFRELDTNSKPRK